MNRMEQLATVVPLAIRRLLRMGEMSQGKLEFAWRLAVGPAIERATTVRLTDRGTLEVRTADARWGRELRHSQTTMLNRVQELLGTEVVKAVKVIGRPAPRN